MPTLDQHLKLMYAAERELYERLIHSKAAFSFQQICLMAQRLEEIEADQREHEDQPDPTVESDEK